MKRIPNLNLSRNLDIRKLKIKIENKQSHLINSDSSIFVSKLKLGKQVKTSLTFQHRPKNALVIRSLVLTTTQISTPFVYPVFSIDPLNLSLKMFYFHTKTGKYTDYSQQKQIPLPQRQYVILFLSQDNLISQYPAIPAHLLHHVLGKEIQVVPHGFTQKCSF